MSRPATTRDVTIASRQSEAARVQQEIMAALVEHDYGENATFAIRLALEEALSNAIRHGNCGDPDKQVEIHWSIDDEAARFQIRDEGCGFHPERVPDPTQEENLQRPCGRGVMLIKAYMTEVSYNEEGNCVEMVKRRDCPLGEPGTNEPASDGNS